MPYLKWNAKVGRWYARDDDGREIEVRQLTAIFDLEHIKVGYIHLAEGAAPDTVWDSNGREAPQPSAQHKRGFSGIVQSETIGGAREFTGCSIGARAAIDELYDDFERAPERRQGLVPVVCSEAVLPVKSRHGQNYRPVLRIVNWVERPAALNGATSSPPVQPPPVPSAPTPIAPWAVPVKPGPSSEVLNDDMPEF